MLTNEESIYIFRSFSTHFSSQFFNLAPSQTGNINFGLIEFVLNWSSFYFYNINKLISKASKLYPSSHSSEIIWFRWTLLWPRPEVSTLIHKHHFTSNASPPLIRYLQNQTDFTSRLLRNKQLLLLTIFSLSCIL